jgi:hypothetical protein
MFCGELPPYMGLAEELERIIGYDYRRE